MNREHLKIPDHEVDAMLNRVFNLMRAALPHPADRNEFERLTGEAQANGYTWIEALEFAAEKLSFQRTC